MGTRIGTFFLIIGGFLLLLYAASLDSGPGVLQWLLVGASSSALGGFLLYRNRERPTSKRFRMVRRLFFRGGKEE